MQKQLPRLQLSKAVSLRVAKTEAARLAGGEGAARARRRDPQGPPGCSDGNGGEAAGQPTAKRAQARLVSSLSAPILKRHLGARETL